DGKVGMFGGSYVGATQMLAAMARPPHLVAIQPYVTASEYYEGWTYQGGALMEWFVTSWSSGLAVDTLRRKAESASHPREWVGALGDLAGRQGGRRRVRQGGGRGRKPGAAALGGLRAQGRGQRVCGGCPRPPLRHGGQRLARRAGVPAGPRPGHALLPPRGEG